MTLNAMETIAICFLLSLSLTLTNIIYSTFHFSSRILIYTPNRPKTNGGPNILSPLRNRKIQRKCVWDKQREEKEMWRSLELFGKVKAKAVSGVQLKWMSTVMCLGDGSQGAVGSPVGLGLHAYEPTPVATLPSDIVSVHAGHYHSLALTSHGHLWAWGRNNEAQLGRGPSSR